MSHATQPRTKQPMATQAALVDGFGRVHTSLRISVTDRCNIRCFYCMPAENIRFKPRSEILTFEEMVRLDADYIARRSLRLDLWILFRTLAAVIGGSGA